MEYTYEYFAKSAEYVRERLNFQPEIGIILGSSLGPFAAQVENGLLQVTLVAECREEIGKTVPIYTTNEPDGGSG